MLSHRTTYRVIYGDTDNMGVAYYANYLRWFEIGRTEMFRHLGLTYSEIEARGIFLPVAEAHCKYLAPAHYDELLVIARYYCKEVEFEHPLVSPVFADVTGLPPIYIQVGEDEILLSDSTRIAEKIEKAGGVVRLEIWPSDPKRETDAAGKLREQVGKGQRRGDQEDCAVCAPETGVVRSLIASASRRTSLSGRSESRVPLLRVSSVSASRG